jgi:hypothetical protein
LVARLTTLVFLLATLVFLLATFAFLRAALAAVFDGRPGAALCVDCTRLSTGGERYHDWR